MMVTLVILRVAQLIVLVSYQAGIVVQEICLTHLSVVNSVMTEW